jgi:hypothetical protein
MQHIMGKELHVIQHSNPSFFLEPRRRVGRNFIKKKETPKKDYTPRGVGVYYNSHLHSNDTIHDLAPNLILAVGACNLIKTKFKMGFV